LVIDAFVHAIGTQIFRRQPAILADVMRRIAVLFVIMFVFVITSAAAQTSVSVRAVRVQQRLEIDGVLEESLYREVAPVSDFVQVEPEAGSPATERTETWIAFDDDYVYVSFRAWDSQMERLVATEMRRDHGNIWQGNDIIVFVFDTFFDRRSSISFTVNPLGGRADGQVVNERQYNADWNPIWTLKTGRFDGGWTLEAALPFKSLRYRTGASQVWGFNAMRVKRSKNEISTLARVPPSQGQQGVEQPSFAATLVGIEAPARRASLDLKPYVTSSASTDRSVSAGTNGKGIDYGFDAKYAVTQNLAADLTYKTDFAQVEADQQQVNLTRFSLFFPEKREFFLENQGTFSFGGVSVGSVNAVSSDAPILFYSRRIGLNGGRQVPIEGGGRLTGRAGRYSIGVLNIQTGTEEKSNARPANFSVVRLKRDLLRRSSIGMIVTNRSAGAAGPEANRACGVDGTFAFFDNLQINTYWARTESEGQPAARPRREDASYRGHLEFTGDRYGMQLERLAIGAQFNPEIGFVRRTDIVRDYAQFRFSPRPRGRSAIRKYVYQASLEYLENGAGRLATRIRSGELLLDFQNSDRVSVSYANTFDVVPEPSRIGGAQVPTGAYGFDSVRVAYNTSQQRTLSANLSAEHGTFYGGHRTTLTVARGRVPITNQFSVEPTYSFNRMRRPERVLQSHLAGSRVTYTMTPLMFMSALVQFNSETHAVSTNARLRWEYQPGSELFVVYNDERDTTSRGFPALSSRALIVKVNRLFRF
jgi:hypothetical protein